MSLQSLKPAKVQKPEKPEGFRQAMAWLHTWTGLLFGWVLFAMLLTGTLAFFRPEITAWMKPEINVQRSITGTESVERAVTHLQTHAANSTRWFITPSSPRVPEVGVGYVDPNPQPGRRAFRSVMLHPETGEELKARETRGGDFFYRFHFELQMSHPWGRWLASIAGMFMLIAIISGVITHKKIFSDFFTFRPGKGGQRAWMDGHNALSVLGLPFHLMITFTGLVLFMSMLMPAGIMAAYKDARAYNTDMFPQFSSTVKAAGRAAPLAPIGPMIELAQTRWNGAEVGHISVNHAGDANAEVVVSASPAAHVSYGRLPPGVTFAGATGKPTAFLGEDNAVRATAGTLIGLHLGLFAEPVLRWLYFLVSLGGTAMVGSGLVLWVVKRRQKAGRDAGQRFSLRLVDGLNVGSVAGIFVGVAAFFLANRLIDAQHAGRSGLETDIFFWAWGATFVYAFLRARTAWRDVLLLAVVATFAVPVVNAFTTERHLGVSLPAGDWVMAGFDLTALGGAMLLAWLAWRAEKKRRANETAAQLASTRSSPATRAPALST